MTRISVRQIVLACAASVVTGCYFPMSPGDDGDWSGCCDFSEVFLVSPAYANILKGDTMTVVSCIGMFDCSQGKAASGNWTVPGGIVATIMVDGTPQSVATGKDRVLLRGVQPGDVQIAAVSTQDQTKKGIMQLRVVDSSAISSIHLYKSIADTVRRGASGFISAQLIDTRGMTIRGRATSWEVSDTNVVALAATGDIQFEAERRGLRAVAPGTTDIHVRFQDITVRLRLTVRE